MPEMDGIEATRRITDRWPQIKIIMSTVFDDDQHLIKSIMAGAGGYLLKDERPERIHKAIYEVLEGGAPMSPSIAMKTLRLLKNGGKFEEEQWLEHFDLTDREQEVLVHLSKGLSYEQIADNLMYNGQKKIKDYRLNGEDNEAYAPVNGMPSWYTINLRFQHTINSHFDVYGGIENILDMRYRSFSSGINGAGRNFSLTLKARL
jgi:CheY-like chemotaxis protein